MKKQSLLRDISGIFSSNVLSVFLTLVAGIIIARYLGPQGKGTFTALTVVPVIVASFAAMGIRRTAVYFIGKRELSDKEVASAVIQILIITSLAGMALTALAFFWLDNPAFTFFLITIVVLIIPFRLSTVYIAGIYIGKQQYRFANMIKWSVPMLNFLLLVLFIIVLNLGIKGALVAMLGSGIIISVVAFYKLHSDIGFTLAWNGSLIKRMLSLGGLYAASLLIMKLIYRIDVLLLERLSDLSEVGYYSIAVNISEQLWQLPMAVGIVLMSRTANTNDTVQMNRQVGQSLRFSLLASLVGATVLFVIAPYLIPWLYGVGFENATILLQIILPGIVLFIIFRILNSHLNGLGKPMPSIYAIAPALVLNIVLNILLIPEYKGLGAVMATNVSYTIGAIIMIFLYIRITKSSLSILFMPKRKDFEIIANKLKTIRR